MQREALADGLLDFVGMADFQRWLQQLSGRGISTSLGWRGCQGVGSG
jgi:hypothetical protein